MVSLPLKWILSAMDFLMKSLNRLLTKLAKVVYTFLTSLMRLFQNLVKTTSLTFLVSSLWLLRKTLLVQSSVRAEKQYKAFKNALVLLVLSTQLMAKVKSKSLQLTKIVSMQQLQLSKLLSQFLKKEKHIMVKLRASLILVHLLNLCQVRKAFFTYLKYLGTVLKAWKLAVFTKEMRLT